MGGGLAQAASLRQPPEAAHCPGPGGGPEYSLGLEDLLVLESPQLVTATAPSLPV